VIPWPARHERRTAIEDARAEKERSAATAAHAARVGREITRLARENHFAAVIESQILRGHE
jgi:hypothetical protein